ncbi:MAG: hypothetical protein EHM12_04670 [Dehalococcoidia bacterium]|nr:MAG: hypothetical protein EHM12_04670 [Dehalococcoidia bacterium]
MEQLNSLYAVWGPFIMLAIIAWTLPWKGVALWKAARNHHTVWFIFILILNTLAILEIIYIFGFSKKKPAPTA